ncbi:Chaperonin complex component, TCP-1 gamma subunit (CCT3) [Pseudoloma neurophilia]|uniref:Chaperonin complex component, TCP-1 gamma subunit (CCT3) n=1 Tax=Pseudoloma neurophilia TaxID=146866 RepID=A0A0R0LV68_9MICR|nr:Chaperonin complex component, TCP-1 gamma subunit (CCT3) [Pseudoloma neurophilia]
MNQQQPQALKCIYLVKDQALQVQIDNINAVNTISSILSTCLGPRSLQKMILTRINTIQITNDGNAILREIDVTHPAAKQIVELARTQDNEVGDGTTSVILLSAKLLEEMGKILKKGTHPIFITKILKNVLIELLEYLNEISFPFEGTEPEKIKIIRNSIENKLCSMLKVDLSKLAYNAVNIAKDHDIKTFVKIEKLPDADFTKCELLDGIMINKTLIHPDMRKEIDNPRILILDCSLEYKKGESKTSYEFKQQGNFSRALEIEEEQITEAVNNIILHKPDIVISEKGISDLAFSLFQKHNITALRRFKRTDTTRIAAATGSTIVSRTEDITEEHIGKKCGLFKVTYVGDESYINFIKCKEPKACTVILRGPSKDILNEFERNFEDAIKVARNLKLSNRLCYGGGATENMLVQYLLNKRKTETDSLKRTVYDGIINSFRIIPLTLIKNSGCSNPLDLMASLESQNSVNIGIDGIHGKLINVTDIIMEPIAIKRQIIESAIEAVILLLRVDGVIQGKN